MSVRTSAKQMVDGVVAAGGAVMLRPGTRANRVVCHQIDLASRQLHYLSGQLEGVRYRLEGRRPAPDVVDNVLADRIRSVLGRIEKRLDLPHVHVMVHDHVAVLHGEVGERSDVERIERAVLGVSGVRGLESYLHVGLGPGDSRPSAGRRVHVPSEALRDVTDAAIGAGVSAEVAPLAVRAVLAGFAARLPEAERDKVSAHLPADLRSMLTPPRRTHRAGPVRTVHELAASILADGGRIEPEQGERVTAAVVQALRRAVPDEATDVAAVLPVELRSLWEGGAATGAGD